MQEAYYFANSFHLFFLCISEIDIEGPGQNTTEVTSANILLAVSGISNLAQL